VPITDVGFEGNGGKYLVLPPDYTNEVTAGYIPVRSKTCNTFTGLRSILASNSEEEERKGDALVKQIKIYPWDAVETVEPMIHGYLSIFFKASCRATSGVAPPFVAISNAAFIELQNLPICGMFGITTPFSAFS
jgi:hypothetical protein